MPKKNVARWKLDLYLIVRPDRAIRIKLEYSIDYKRATTFLVWEYTHPNSNVAKTDHEIPALRAYVESSTIFSKQFYRPDLEKKAHSTWVAEITCPRMAVAGSQPQTTHEKTGARNTTSTQQSSKKASRGF